MFKCKYCGQEFESKQKLGGHVTHCKMNPNYDKNKLSTNNIKNVDNSKQEKQFYICKWCGKEFYTTKSGIAFHENRCIKNPNRKIHPGNHGHTTGHTAWNKGLTANNDERVKRITNKRKESFKNKKWIPNPHRWTQEEKEQIRLNTIKYIESLNGPYKCKYSINACQYINKLNEEKHWNLQHAENGGEIEVGGYFLDGYDKDLNIVFEYDEPYHYESISNNVLKKHDIERQNYIIEKLHCEFWRYNEKLDLLYKVN